MTTPRVLCRTPTPGKTGVTRIPEWKFDLVRAAILEDLKDGAVRFSELPDRIALRLTDEDRQKLGSLGWHVTTVKLEMETRGEIKRLKGQGPQLLALGSP